MHRHLCIVEWATFMLPLKSLRFPLSINFLETPSQQPSNTMDLESRLFEEEDDEEQQVDGELFEDEGEGDGEENDTQQEASSTVGIQGTMNDTSDAAARGSSTTPGPASKMTLPVSASKSSSGSSPRPRGRPPASAAASSVGKRYGLREMRW